METPEQAGYSAAVAATNPFTPAVAAQPAQAQQAGAPAQPQAPHPDFAKGPAQPGEIREGTIYVKPSDWNAINQELIEARQFRAQHAREQAEKENDRLRLMAEKGQVDQALTAQRTAYETKLKEAQTKAEFIEKNWLNEKRSAAIRDALAGRQFSGVDPAATARMVRQLLEMEVEAVLGPQGEPQVRDRSQLRPADSYLKERLDSPDFAVFFASKSGGGSGTDGTRTPATPTTAAPPPQPLLDWKQSQDAWSKSNGMGGFIRGVPRTG